jgi:hypothetical protein
MDLRLFADTRIAPVNESFIAEYNLLITSDRTKIVRFFRRELDVIVLVMLKYSRNCSLENAIKWRYLFLKMDLNC